ncbi:MAG TPA: RNA polymerase subunit sigma, partial [Candidatus Kryptonia bacterium]|nr:RNA polymerase subunit sigma [Candidatus Kryptonia bacterium]
RELQERTREALAQFMTSLLGGDVRAIEAMLADSVHALSDGGGEFFAARKPLLGRDRVVRFHWNLWRRRMAGARFAARMINGLPAIVGELVSGKPGEPPRIVFRCDVDEAGRITALHSIVATRKLTAIDFAFTES